MIRRLRIKFVCITMVIVTVMMTVLLVSQLNATRSSLMQRNARALQDAFLEYGQRQPLPELRPMPDRRGSEKPDFVGPQGQTPCFVMGLDGSGNLLAVGSGYYDLSDQTLLLDIYQRAADKNGSTGVLWEYELQYLRGGNEARPLYAFTDISGDLETMREMTRNSGLLWLLGFGGFLILSILLANWAIRPVEQAWQQQRQFVADASHELKTPLTVIMTNAELLRERAEDDQQRQFSDSIVTMSRQMRSLVERMLQLARADSGQTAAQQEKLNFSDLLEQSLLPFEPLFFEQGLTMKSRIQPDVPVTGNSAQLRQVAEILLDNAMKYSTPGGTVRLTLESRSHQCCLSVSNPGHPLTPQQCRDIFKRFYRVDPARSRNGSYGLGLAIAERIVADHHGRIRAESTDGENTFYVTLPMPGACDR